MHKADDFPYVSVPSLLQGVEHALAEEGKARPAVAHPFDELELVHLALDQTV